VNRRRREANKKLVIVGAIVIVIALLAIIYLFIFSHIEANQLRSTQTPFPSPLASPELPLDYTNLTLPPSEMVDVKVLMYHHIGPLPSDADDIRKGLTVSADDFEKQMKYLKENGYDVITLRDMYLKIAEGKLLPKTAVLTFDDGYVDNYEYALPILQKYGFHGTFFIITGKVDNAEYMSKAQLIELVRADNELGSHSVTHPDLVNLSASKLDYEISESKKYLDELAAELAGEKTISLCYPSGEYNAQVIDEAKASGYKIAVTTHKGDSFSTNMIFEVPRYRINPDTNLEKLLE